MSTPAPVMDAAAQIETLRQDRIDGKIGERDFLAHMERLAPQVAEPPPPASQAEARARIDALKVDLGAGRVTPNAYLEQLERLGPVAAPDTEFSPEMQRQLDADMAPPPDPMAYRFEYSNHDPSPADLAWDQKVRTGFHELGLPQAIAAPIHRSVEALGQRFIDAAPEAIVQHTKTVESQLRELWGAQFDAKIVVIDTLIDGLNGELGDAVRAAPWLLADVHTLTSLDHFADYRSKRR